MVSLGCDIGTGVLNRGPVVPNQVISNIAGNEKDSLLAGQGLLKDKYRNYNPEVKSPGKAVPVEAIPDDYYNSPHLDSAPLLPVSVPVPTPVAPTIPTTPDTVPVQEPVYYATPPTVPTVQEYGSPIVPVQGSEPEQSEATHPLFADAPAGEEDLFK